MAPAHAAVGIDREANGCAYTTIADALASALPGDSLWIESGTYAESGLLVTIDVNLVHATAGCTSPLLSLTPTVVVDGGGNQVLSIVGAPGLARVVISGVELTNGSAVDGGVVNIGFGDLELLLSVISEGTASNRGGCVFVDTGSTLTVTGSVIRSCSASREGGGAAAVNSTVELYGISSIEESESGTEGGGLWASNSTVRIEDDAQIYDNIAVGGGGLCTPGSRVTLTDNAIIHNNSAQHGAGVALPGTLQAPSELTLRDQSTITLNTASGGFGGQGGGVLMSTPSDGSIVTVDLFDNSSVSANVSDAGGGFEIIGLHNTLTLHPGSSVTGNTGSGIRVIGGGTGVDAAQVLGTDTLIADNVNKNDGGGCRFVDGEHSFVDSRFLNNTSDGSGGALSVGEGAIVSLSASLDNGCVPNLLPADTYCSEVSDNIADVNGGGAHVSGILILDRTAFQRNEAIKGGALHVKTGATAYLVNSLVASNVADPTSAAIQTKGSLFSDHVTIADNFTVGLRYRPGSTGVLMRSIVFDNLGSDLHVATLGAVSSCNTVGIKTGPLPIIGGFSSLNPLFIANLRGAHRLAAVSPAVDVCIGSTDPDLDLSARPSGAGDDRGAFER